MGWSTNLFCNVEFHKRTYNNIYEVESDLEESHALLKEYENTLRDYCIMTEPEKYFGKDNAYYELTTSIQNILQEYKEEIVNNYKLHLLKDNWDACHKDNLAIDPPDDIKWDTAFLNGDFIKSIKYPDNSDTI